MKTKTVSKVFGVSCLNLFYNGNTKQKRILLYCQKEDIVRRLVDIYENIEVLRGSNVVNVDSDRISKKKLCLDELFK